MEEKEIIDETTDCEEEITDLEKADNDEKGEEKKFKKVKESKQDKIKELEDKIKEKDDMYLRLLAEYDNYKKRTIKEREINELTAVADTVKNILPLADNVERAVSSSGDVETLKKGIEMSLSQFLENLKKIGLEEIDTTIPFNPELHNAVMHIDDENYKDGEILEVFQKGYKIKNKIIRYAVVKVAN